MRINVAVPEAHVSPRVLNAALEGVTRLNEELISSGSVPTFRQSVDHVRWQPEPPGAEHFDHAAMVESRGWGDCDDLGPWHAASLRVTGEDPEAKAVVRKSGHKRWHCVVRRSDGTIDDPSREAGMHAAGGVVGISGAWVPPMFARTHGVGGSYIALPQLALRPVWERHGRPEDWQARADIPWHWQPGDSDADVAMVSLHKTPVPDQALVGACRGAIALGEASGFASDDDLDRLEAICDACDGATWEELADEYGPEHATAAGHLVGSWFGKLTRKVSRAVKHPGRIIRPLAQHVIPMAASLVPGAGPVANLALQAASPHLRKLIRSGRHKPPHERGPRRARGVPKHRHMIYTSGPVAGWR